MVRKRRLKKKTIKSKAKAAGKRAAKGAARGSTKAAKGFFKGGQAAAKRAREEYKKQKIAAAMRKTGVVVKCPVCRKQFIAATQKGARYWLRNHINKNHT